MASAHELAQRDYILGLKYREIAEKYNVSVDTVKKWKTRYDWERDKPVKKPSKTVPNVHKTKKVDKSEEPGEELNDREQLFCYHYVRTWNATQAAMKSGYSQNKPAAGVEGCRLLQRPRVKTEVDRLKALFRQEIHVDILDFLGFCMKIVGADIGDYITFGRQDVVVGLDNDGKPIKRAMNYVSLAESEMVDTSVLTEVKEGKDGVSIKLADKQWAWEQLSKYFDWLPETWKRNIETDKLEIERQKVEVLKQRNGAINDDAEPVQFVDDIGGDDDADD